MFDFGSLPASVSPGSFVLLPSVLPTCLRPPKCWLSYDEKRQKDEKKARSSLRPSFTFSGTSLH